MSETTVKKIQSVQRAIAILKCFDTNEELGLTEISNLVKLHKSTTAGIVNTLKSEKFLEQNEATGKLRLGFELFRISTNVKFNLRKVCMPYLEELLNSTKETVNLVVRNEDNVIYVEKKESRHSMRICTSVGKSMPLYCTGVGKSILAFLKEDEIEEILNRTQFIQYTSKTIISKAALMRQIIEIRNQGYAFDDEELEYGLVCVAVPILNDAGHPIAGISVSGPSMRMTPNAQSSIAKQLITTAKIIEKKIL